MHVPPLVALIALASSRSDAKPATCWCPWVMASSFRVSVALRSSFIANSFSLDRASPLARAVHLNWQSTPCDSLGRPPVQCTWRAALWTSPRPSTAVWLGHSLLSTETASCRACRSLARRHRHRSPLISWCSIHIFHAEVSFRPRASHHLWHPSGGLQTVSEVQVVAGCIHPSASANNK